MITLKQTHADFNSMIQPYYKSLQNTAKRLTKDQLEAEDLLQDTLYKAYRSYDQFQQDTNFRAWIFKIMINTYISMYRKAIRRPSNVSYEELEEYQLYYHIQSESDLTTSENFNFSDDMFEDEVKEALEKIPYYFRLVVLLNDIEGFSYQEIADIVKIPLGTVMSRLHRGRSLLRNKLKKYAKEKGYALNTY
jgi:RNA polymerase sigma-70 factor (ECF subfamily)